MDFDEDNFEVSAKEISSNSNLLVSGLSDVMTLEEALSRFGYQSTDNIPRRDLVLIYAQTKHALEIRMKNCAANNHYEIAKELRQRLEKLRKAFDQYELKKIENNSRDQKLKLKNANDKISENLKATHINQEHSLNDYCQSKIDGHNQTFDILHEKLHEKLDKMKMPNVKYSKRLLSLFEAEKNLNKLKLFEDALKVRLMINKLQPIEEYNFQNEFNLKKGLKKKQLERYENVENKKLDEYLKTIQWKDIRRRERESNVHTQRFSNHIKDMDHAHILEHSLKPESVLKPTATWQKRKGYEATSSSLRGNQLLTLSNAPSESSSSSPRKVFVDSLVSVHSFTDTLNGTKTISFKKY